MMFLAIEDIRLYELGESSYTNSISPCVVREVDCVVEVRLIVTYGFQ